MNNMKDNDETDNNNYEHLQAYLHFQWHRVTAAVALVFIGQL